MIGIMIDGQESDIYGLRRKIAEIKKYPGEALPKQTVMKQINDNRDNLMELLAQKKPLIYLCKRFHVSKFVIIKWIRDWKLQKQAEYLNLELE